MDPQSAFTFQDLFTFVISDMAKAISQRSGETGDQHFARSRAAAHMILGFLPRDVIEASKWLNLSTAAAPPRAREGRARMRDAVGTKMTRGEIAQARARALGWAPVPEH